MNHRLPAILAFVFLTANCYGQNAQKLTSHQLAMKAHPKDRMLQAEHEELLDLLTPETANYTAIRNGRWSDPRIWKEGEVPGNGGRVLILEGTSVILDDISRARLRWLRIDGALEFASDKNTGLVIETMLVSPT